MKKRTRVLVANSDSLFRLGVISLLRQDANIHVVGVASAGTDVAVTVDRLRPHVVLLDVEMGDNNGLHIAQSIRAASPNTRVVLTANSEDYLLDSINSGVRGYVLTTSPPDLLVAAIKGVARGEICIVGHGDPVGGSRSRRPRRSARNAPDDDKRRS